MTSPMTLHIIDPLNRTGKIDIPADVVVPTLGMQEYLASAGQRDYSLCLLFQSQNCNAGERCHQIHVPPEYVMQLRQQASGSTCCRRHGDARSQETGYAKRLAAIPQLSIVIPIGNQRQKYIMEPDLLARTLALEGLLDRHTYTFPAANVCRLHQQERCRFGKDCKNIHVCREFYRMLGAIPGVAGFDVKGAKAHSGPTLPGVSPPMPAPDSPQMQKQRPVPSPPRSPKAPMTIMSPNGPLQIRVGNPPPPAPEALSNARTVHGPYATGNLMPPNGPVYTAGNVSVTAGPTYPLSTSLPNGTSTFIGNLQLPAQPPYGGSMPQGSSYLTGPPANQPEGPYDGQNVPEGNTIGGPSSASGPISNFDPGYPGATGNKRDSLDSTYSAPFIDSSKLSAPVITRTGSIDPGYQMSGMMPQHRLASIDATNANPHRASIASMSSLQSTDGPAPQIASRGSLDHAMYAFTGSFIGEIDGPPTLFPHGNAVGAKTNDEPNAGKMKKPPGQLSGRPPVQPGRNKESNSKRPPPVLIIDDNSNSQSDRPLFPPEPPTVVSPQMPTPSSRYTSTLSPHNFQFNNPPYPSGAPSSSGNHAAPPLGPHTSLPPQPFNPANSEPGAQQFHAMPHPHGPYPPGMVPMGGYFHPGEIPMASTPTPMRKLKAFSHMWGDIPPSLPSPSPNPSRYPVAPMMGPG